MALGPKHELHPDYIRVDGLLLITEFRVRTLLTPVQVAMV